MPASFRWVAFSTSFRAIGTLSSPTLVGAFASLRDGTAQPIGKYWLRWSCVLIFVHIYGESSSLCTHIIVCFGGYRSLGIVMEYWLDGICCWDSFLLHPGTPHANADGLSRQCGQCLRPGSPVSSLDQDTGDADSSSVLMGQPFASSAMGDSMDEYLLPELSGKMWVAAIYLEEMIADLPPANSELNLKNASRVNETLITVREWIQAGLAPPWSECLGLSPELQCWRLQFGNLSVDTDGRLWRCRAPPATNSQLVVSLRECRELIRCYHDSLFTGHLAAGPCLSPCRGPLWGMFQ